MATLNLDQLESRLQALIEVRLVDILPSRGLEDTIAQALAAAVRENISQEGDGPSLAPNVYTLVAHPDRVQTWQHSPRLLVELREILNTVIGETSLEFALAPTFSITADGELGLDEVRMIASHALKDVEDTRGMQAETGAEGEDALPENAFLIVEGVKVFPLKHAVVNIGRRLDNQLVIDDPRISRNHVQLRAIKGRYVLFDLNSTGGTFVHGQRANQTVLYPGDVISLAGVPLIFGQDNPPPRPDLAQTEPLSQAGNDRPTAFLSRVDEPKPPKKK